MSCSSLSSLSSNSSINRPRRRVRRNVRRLREIRDRINASEKYDDHDFKIRFRFTKRTVKELLEIIGPLVEPPTSRNKSIPALTQLLITLRFYATGAFQQVIGDTFNVGKSTVYRIIHRVTYQIASMKNTYIKMPREREEIEDTVTAFYSIARFPCVIGAIDCTHIWINSPGGHNAELFKNRKGYFSINVQMICNAKLKILHIIARWPGSVHDSTIFNDSPIIYEFENGFYGDKYLLGDSGYPCKRYLLIPLLHTSNPAEEAYNAAHINTRNTIERCFGVLKRRFPCLHIGMALKINNILPIIVACSVPINELPVPNNDAVTPNEEIQADTGIEQNTAVRTALINTVFVR